MGCGCATASPLFLDRHIVGVTFTFTYFFYIVFFIKRHLLILQSFDWLAAFLLELLQAILFIVV